jgi:hypothetical protein
MVLGEVTATSVAGENGKGEHATCGIVAPLVAIVFAPPDAGAGKSNPPMN